MKSIDYKNKLIRVLKKDFPIDMGFYVKCKKYDHRKDDWFRNNAQFVQDGRKTECMIGMYADVKRKKTLHFSNTSNHPSVYMAAILLQSNQYEQNQKSVTNLCK
jgi:hypothetical protein